VFLEKSDPALPAGKKLQAMLGNPGADCASKVIAPHLTSRVQLVELERYRSNFRIVQQPLYVNLALELRPELLKCPSKLGWNSIDRVQVVGHSFFNPAPLK
jgi:hypothetical protein